MMRALVRSAICALFCAALLLMGAAAPSSAAELPRLTPSQVLANPDAFAGKRIVVEGLLDNAGTNFFTDLRLVLKDVEGSGALFVQPWLPLEAPPGPGAGPEPETLAAYLDKRVILQGIYQQDNIPRVGRTRVLVVESARRVE